MNRIGVMQGRLVPPENGRFQSFPNFWRQEFPKAKKAGVEFIEWIVDNQPNPLFSDHGVDEIKAMKHKWGIAVPAICADCLMEPALHENSYAWSRALRYILVRAPLIGVRRVIIPFVDAAKIVDEDAVVRALRDTYEGIELHLETDLPPDRMASLLALLPPHVKANWDSGNSSGLGYIASEEFAAYGKRIGSIHIKDRYRRPGGGIETRPLGNGSADFDDVFASICGVGYSGDLTLQVARGEDGDEVNWIGQQAEFVRERLCVSR